MVKNFLMILLFLFASLAFARQTSANSFTGKASACSKAKSACTDYCYGYKKECIVKSSCDCEKKGDKWSCYVDCEIKKK